MAGFFSGVIARNALQGGHYVEPFAGGAGVALHLLLHEHVQTVHLNDVDRSIYAFWYAVCRRNERLCKMIRSVAVSTAEWDRQRDIQRYKTTAPLLDLAFSTLFLNRTNRSGILRAGMIGGREQKGHWKLNARFNKETLIERIGRLRRFARRININCEDALAYLRNTAHNLPRRSLIYLDPPYFKQGPDLYLSYYRPSDHETLAAYIHCHVKRPWILTYDNARQIRRLYAGYKIRSYAISYTADRRRTGRELLVSSPLLVLPPLSGLCPRLS